MMNLLHSTTQADPRDVYKTRQERSLREAEALESTAGLIGGARFITFVLACGSLWATLAQWPGFVPRIVPGMLLLLLVVGFIALLAYHATVLRRRDLARLIAEVNADGLLRLSGEWAKREPPRRYDEFLDPKAGFLPPYSADLDLTGPASLLQLINASHTKEGERALLAALSHAKEPHKDPSAARRRQEAVSELAPLVDLRQNLDAAGRMLGLGRKTLPDPEGLLRWAEGPALLERAGVRRVVFVLPLLLLVLLALQLVFGSQKSYGPILGYLTYGLLGLQALIFAMTESKVIAILEKVEAGETALGAYAEMLSVLSEAHFQTKDNRALIDKVRTQGRSPSAQLRRLQGNYGQLELRRNPLFWLPMNILFLWDLFFALRLEAWQKEVGSHLRGWLAALGELEARASLSILAYENPDWAWPTLEESHPPCFEVIGLGHPLIHRNQRVENDLTLPGPGKALLITGSNMSGKSTLLRSIGLCHVLAQAGAPVCAKEARLSPMTLRTVMRVDDSLAQGVSHFYAELRRLKETIDQSHADPPLCYLLDEILHGTNTREREIGARLTIQTLLRRGAMGAVSTHDLSLTSLEQETGGAVQNVHFTEDVIKEAGQMHFDYRLRQGPVTTTNALRLMQQCGIELDWSSIPSDIAPPSPQGV